MYDKLVAKENNIDISGFVLETNFDTDKSELEKKIPDTSGLVKKTDYNAKITEIESQIPSITGLATNSVLTAVENKIPNVSNLVKTQIMTKILVKLKKNLLIIYMINILLLQNLTSLQQFTKTDFDNKLISLYKKTN